MRVLHLGKYFPPRPGGMESFLGDLAMAQVRQGHAVAVLVHGNRNSVRDDSGVQLYEAKATRELLYAPVSLQFPRLLKQAIEHFQPDVIHAHLPNLSAFWLIAIRDARKIPWVIQWQSDVRTQGVPPRLKLAYQAYRVPERALLRRCASVICSSPDYLASSKTLSHWRDKARVVPLGIDPARLQAHGASGQADRLWQGGGALRVLIVGRLAHYKGHEVFLDTLKQLSGVQAIVAGDGELKRTLQKKIIEYGLESRARILGHTEKAVLLDLLDTCDVLCLPSTARTESFGMVLLEAMAFGKPVVATDVHGSGMPWLVRTAGHGHLARPRDPESLRDVLEAMKNPELRERLGRAGTKALDQRFHIDRIAREIDTLYREAAGGADA